MDAKEQVVEYVETRELKPYKNNPRKNQKAVDAVAASIEAYGFRNPIIINKDNVIINGHTRLKAAIKLGLHSVPCIRTEDLPEEKQNEFRLIDNKTSEYASWDAEKLQDELLTMDLSGLSFNFDFSSDAKKTKAWEQTKKLCDLKDAVGLHKAMDTFYASLFKTGKAGKPLDALKIEGNVPLFSTTAADYVFRTLGNVDKGDWGLVTTPRRRHATGFHFATAVCEDLAQIVKIPFYKDFVTAKNRDRINPRFEYKTWPEERNLILYDDILTTGVTVNRVRGELLEHGYTVMTLISIDNH